MNVYDAAFTYRDAGISVLPICADGSKRAALPWKEYETRLATDAELYRWFYHKAVGIAVIGGAISGNLEALDFDAPGVLYEFRDACKGHGLMDVLRACPLVETPSGGNHLYYRCDGPANGNQKLASTVTEVPESTDGGRRVDDRWYKVETLIETRGEGGYAIVPPSPAACHPDGKEYVYKRSLTLADVPIITTESRALLHQIARSFGHPMPQPTPRPQREYTGPTDGLTPWDDFDRRGANEARQALEAAGWTMTRRSGDREEWCRPGKQGAVSATWDYCKSNGTPLFYVFSSNAYPFDAGQSYGAYNIFKLLQHGGDGSSAAKELARMGFGDRQGVR